MCKLLLMVNMIWSGLTRETSYQQPCLGGTVLIRLRWKNYLKKGVYPGLGFRNAYRWVMEQSSSVQLLIFLNLTAYGQLFYTLAPQWWTVTSNSEPRLTAFLKFLLPGYFISKTRNITMIGNFYFYFITEIRIILMQ